MMETPYWIDYALQMGGGLSGTPFIVGMGSLVVLFVLSTLMLIFLPMTTDDVKGLFTRAEREDAASHRDWKGDMLANHTH